MADASAAEERAGQKPRCPPLAAAAEPLEAVDGRELHGDCATGEPVAPGGPADGGLGRFEWHRRRAEAAALFLFILTGGPDPASQMRITG